MKEKQICVLQTSFARRDDTIAYLAEKAPGVRVTFITDDTLLSDVRANGGPTPSVYGRMALYAQAAVLKGADLILNSCSSVGDVADNFARTVSVPVLRIEDPLCRQAAAQGRRIALLSTVPTSAPPIERLIRRYATAAGREPEFRHINQDAAWDALSAGDSARHNALLLDSIGSLEREGWDTIVLTQVSMRALLPDLKGVSAQVLCSFASGLDRAAEMIREAGL